MFRYIFYVFAMFFVSNNERRENIATLSIIYLFSSTKYSILLYQYFGCRIFKVMI